MKDGWILQSDIETAEKERCQPIWLHFSWFKSSDSKPGRVSGARCIKPHRF